MDKPWRLVIHRLLRRTAMVCTALLVLGGCVTAPTPDHVDVLAEAFQPDDYPAELAGSELILNVAARAKDDILPAYSFAVFYSCTNIGSNQCRRDYLARLLRIPPDEYRNSLALAGRLQGASGDAAARKIMDEAGLDWLQADLRACPDALDALEAVRTSTWGPKPHYGLVEPDGILVHPAIVRIEMAGMDETTSYKGWVLADGPPAAVRQLLAILDPCWKPAPAPPPWRRVRRRP
jgi:hypothetical protein